MIFYVATLLSFMIHLILCFSCIFICMLSARSYVLGYVFTNDICSKQRVYLWKFFQAKHLLLKFLKIGSLWRTLALNRWKDRFKPKSTHLCTIFPWVLIFRETLYVYFSQIWYVFDYCFFKILFISRLIVLDLQICFSKRLQKSVNMLWNLSNIYWWGQKFLAFPASRILLK